MTLTTTEGYSDNAAREGHKYSMVFFIQLKGNDFSVLFTLCITPVG